MSEVALEIPARTTSIFAEEFETQIAINASFFEPFRPGNFYWDYYPHNGDPVNVIHPDQVYVIGYGYYNWVKYWWNQSFSGGSVW